MFDEIEIEKIMTRTGMGKVQAINHLRSLRFLQSRINRRPLTPPSYWQNIDEKDQRIPLTEIVELPSIGNRHRVGG